MYLSFKEKHVQTKIHFFLKIYLFLCCDVYRFLMTDKAKGVNHENFK